MSMHLERVTCQPSAVRTQLQLPACHSIQLPSSDCNSHSRFSNSKARLYLESTINHPYICPSRALAAVCAAFDRCHCSWVL
jgi:hypothetical protein